MDARGSPDSIKARRFTRTEEELRPGRPEPNWLKVHRERKRGKHVTLGCCISNRRRRIPRG
jgi:hypothetical protein